ncbi:MAG: exosortase/archaeosortase family protein [Bryobacteraceae bacterium]
MKIWVTVFCPRDRRLYRWQRRHELMGRVSNPNYFGLAIVAFACVQLMLGTLGAELFLARTAFVEAIVGVVLFLGGTHAIKVLGFPLLLLCFMVPIPAVIYNQITFPLQLFASRVAAGALELMGYPVLREGNVLELASQKLSVVEACSGIRSLLSLSFLSLVYAYFFDKKSWMRVALLLATVPIAILANAGRVTFTGMLSEIDPELAHGFMHTASGWVIFMIALVILVVVHQIFDRIYNSIQNKNRQVTA